MFSYMSGFKEIRYVFSLWWNTRRKLTVLATCKLQFSSIRCVHVVVHRRLQGLFIFPDRGSVLIKSHLSPWHPPFSLLSLWIRSGNLLDVAPHSVCLRDAGSVTSSRFTHAVSAAVRTSPFLRLDHTALCGWTDHILFIHASVDGHRSPSSPLGSCE